MAVLAYKYPKIVSEAIVRFRNQKHPESAEDMADNSATYVLTGPLLLGYQFDWALYGVLAVQTYVYYQSNKPDTRLIKSLVYGLMIVETLQIIVATHDSFNELVYSWGNEESLVQLYLTWLTVPILTGLTSCVIQCFYAWRIYILSKSKVISGSIVLISLMQCAAALGEAAECLIIKDVPKTQVDTFKTTIVWLGGTAACDIIICCAMVYYLAKGRRGFSNTDTMLKKLITLIVETGMATAIVAILELTMFLKFKNNFFHIVPALILSKLYSNSLLVLLNSRHSIKASQNSAQYIHDSSQLSNPGRNMRTNNTIQVNVSRETDTTNDIAMLKLDRGSDDTRAQFEHKVPRMIEEV